MDFLQLPTTVGLLTALSSIFFLLYLRNRGRAEVLLTSLATSPERADFPEALDMERPFADRVVWPVFRALLRALARFMPQRNLEQVRNQIMEAGQPRGLTVTDIIGLRLLSGLTVGTTIFLLFRAQHRPFYITVLLTAATGIIGMRLPGVWLQRLARQRQQEILRALPDALDILSISVSAGLGFDGAVQKLVEKWDNALTREFGRALREIRVGVPRTEALRQIATRNGVSELSNFIAIVVQADQLGLSIGNVLRGQADQMRQFRRQRAEELAHLAPVKMLFPLVFFIFPALFAVILGPAVPRLMVMMRDVFGGG